MIRLGPEWTRKRRGFGALLLFALAALLAVPLFGHGGLDHPLRGSEATDLCPLLPPPPAALAVQRQQPPRSDSGSASCFYFATETHQPVLAVTLTSTRQMSRETPIRSEKMFGNWMAEIQASYGRRGEVAGNWAMAGSWRAGAQESLLFEDRGVLVLVESMGLDAAQLAEHARRVQGALRNPPPPK